MAYLEHIATLYHVDVDMVVGELERQPELWDRNRWRKDRPNSPHREMSDIWLRFADPAHPERFHEPHHSVFWPAWWAIPTVHDIVFDAMRDARATELGGILITKVPPGKQIYAHHDRGVWHAEHYNFKVYIVLQGNQACVNWASESPQTRAVMKTGEVWYFNNLVDHGLVNEGVTDRISLIVSMRTEHEPIPQG